MEFNNSIDITIHKYLKGQLSGSSLIEFENLLLQNPELQKQVNDEQILYKLISQNELMDFRNMVSNIHIKHEKNAKTKKVILTTAIVLGVVGVGIGIKYAITAKEKTQPKDVKKAEVPNTKIITHNLSIEKHNSTYLAKELDKDIVTKQNKGITNAITTKDTLIEISESIQPKLIVETTQSNKSTLLEQKNPQTSKVDCNSYQINFEFEAIKSCKNKAEGGIDIKHISGGQKPYAVNIFDATDNTEKINHHLSIGDYSIEITDKNRCKSQIQHFSVEDKNCMEHIFLNTSLGETWKSPTENNASELTIVDKAGNLYFSKQLDSNESLEWDGKSNSGNLVLGYYIYQLKFNNGKIYKGSITVSE